MDIIIYGAGGVMGRKLVNEISLREEICIKELVDPMAEGFLSSLKDYQEEADLIIDFSHPSNLADILKYAIRKKVPTLLCTTGYSSQMMLEIEEAGKEIPILQAGNTSIGIAVMKVLLENAVKQLSDWDVEIIESHHNRKLDSPSGTAKELIGILQKGQKRSNLVFGRNSNLDKREKGDIGIHSIRGGTIVGEHKVIFAGQDEVLEIKHQAISRDLFVAGAIKLAFFIVKQKPGVYEVQDAYR